MPRQEKPQRQRDVRGTTHIERHFKNGKLVSEGEVSPVKRVRTGRWISYAKDGKTPVIEKRYSQRGRKCFVTMLRADGTMYAQYAEFDGVQTGYAWHFHRDGETVQQIGNYVDNEQNGIKLTFNENGYLLGNDENDELAGVQYIVDGQLDRYLSGYLYAGLVQMQFDENLRLIEKAPHEQVGAMLDYVEQEVGKWEELNDWQWYMRSSPAPGQPG
jgi:hypothetical protein